MLGLTEVDLGGTKAVFEDTHLKHLNSKARVLGKNLTISTARIPDSEGNYFYETMVFQEGDDNGVRSLTGRIEDDNPQLAAYQHFSRLMALNINNLPNGMSSNADAFLYFNALRELFPKQKKTDLDVAISEETQRKYAGEWIAIRHGKIIEHNKDLSALTEKTIKRNPIYHCVPESDEL